MFNIRGFSWQKSRGGRVFLAVFVLVLFGFLVLFITAPKPKTFKVVIAGQEYTDKEKARERLVQELEKDSDNDGLKDWEEAIYHTDPNNPDTDGDGAPDGQEIKEGRDPLKKGPDDTFSAPVLLPAELIMPDQNFKYDEKNLTQSFTKKLLESNLINNLLQIKDRETFSQNIEQFVGQSNILSYQAPKTYTLDKARLHTIDAQTPEAIKQYLAEYANLLGDAISKNPEKLSDAPIIDAFLKNNINELYKLDSIISGYKELSEKSYAVSVPKNMLWFHQNMFTFISRTINELSALRTMDTDPLRAAPIVPEYGQTKLFFLMNTNLLKEWLLSKNITYAQHEPKPFFLFLIQ